VSAAVQDSGRQESTSKIYFSVFCFNIALCDMSLDSHGCQSLLYQQEGVKPGCKFSLRPQPRGRKMRPQPWSHDNWPRPWMSWLGLAQFGLKSLFICYFNFFLYSNWSTDTASLLLPALEPTVEV